ncbi:MAG: carbohydrate ABC transporter permease [Halanaerobiaceae bacterium]
MNLQIRKKRLSRSTGGDVFIMTILLIGAAFTALPLLLITLNAFKPLNELLIFPPRFFVSNPTLRNFRELFTLMQKSWIPLSRYLFNSLTIIVLSLLGNLFFASLAAFTLSKYEFRGKRLYNEIIVLSLMFAYAVIQIPQYLVTSYLGWINTYWAIIVPSWGQTLGLYLMKNFIDEMVDDYIMEAAKIDGASPFKIYWHIVMPIIKPAWLTLIILEFQRLWRFTGGQFIYAEELKTLPYALNQIVVGGVARMGVGAVVMFLMMLIPILLFILTQSQIIETMGTSGID